MYTRRLLAVVMVLTLVALSVPLVPRAAAAVDLQLWGSNAGGWGRDSVNLTKPGPFLTYPNGTQLNLILHSQDSPSQHNWFVDYNGDKNNASEPSSGNFSSAAATTFLVTLNREGNFTYRCIFHNAMSGTINISAAVPGGGGLGGGTPLPGVFNWNLIILIVAIVGSVVAGVVVLLKMRRRPS